MEWKEFYLDLNDLIKTDPGAIYQVRIGFRQEYAINPCVDQSSIDIEKAQSDQIYFKDESGNRTSIMDNFFGGIPYNENYTWANRENPCFPEFYNSDRFVSGNLLVSNYGITAKRGSDDLVWVSVSDLITTDPVGNITIDIYNEANDLISQVKTDQDGIAKINVNNENPAVVVAHSGKNKGYLRLKEEDALNLSRFDISGEQVKGDVRGFIYAERNIWKPGDSLFFNFILIDK
ncbi:MAG: alpha-2-macroglobulin, partial [Saprospiraceae bacterium]|nr:alpha-2-macroglobulin [Saprospiraceae bacterium]